MFKLPSGRAWSGVRPASKWSVPGSLIACPALTRHKCIKINCGKLEYQTSKVYTIFPHFSWYIWYFILNPEKEKEYPFSHGYFDFTKVISDTFHLSCLTLYEGTCYSCLYWLHNSLDCFKKILINKITFGSKQFEFTLSAVYCTFLYVQLA